MHIYKVEVEGVPPLEQEVSINCDERVNLFIGPNASGKTTILRAMNGLNSCLADGGNPPDPLLVIVSPEPEDERSRTFCFLWVSDDWPRDAKEALIPTALPVLYIPGNPNEPPGPGHLQFQPDNG